MLPLFFVRFHINAVVPKHHARKSIFGGLEWRSRKAHSGTAFSGSWSGKAPPATTNPANFRRIQRRKEDRSTADKMDFPEQVLDKMQMVC
jgi:hypothetical protein